MNRIAIARLGQATMNWNYFLGASILAGGLLLKFGAPPMAVLAGITLAALWNWKRPR